MHVTFSPGKLIATCLFAASLFFPSFAIAEQQQEELAPGFDACMKRAKTIAKDDKNSLEYVKCYHEAGDYWQNIFETEYKTVVSQEGDIFEGEYVGITLQEIRLAWEQYFYICGLRICHEAGDIDPRYQLFRAEEYKKLVQMLREYGIFEKPLENPLQETIMNAITRQN